MARPSWSPVALSSVSAKSFGERLFLRKISVAAFKTRDVRTQTLK